MAMRARLLHILMVGSMLMSYTKGDSAEEKQKCAEQLTGIATCLPYVGGDAKAPTPDCCSGLKQAIQNNKKCVCVIIKDRNDPDLGLKINITLALRLPSVCKVPANFTECPTLLHLDPKSAEAKAFNQLGDQNSTYGGSGSPSPSPSPSRSPAAEQNPPSGTSQGTGEEGEGPAATSNPAKNSACYNGKRLFKFLVAAAGLLFWL
ncbi:hypothetical protein L6164_006066 [Bauhinia variegata]|uniref:Uncharacterized protein n=1 Tax=Bauhinia variegata TaxID=167791 RepID=A0ACB9PT62_BAUVA|nr:hypothetical protein L6164_006066 [Bauhinia variegata]